MKKLFFCTKINDSELTGLVDVSVSPPAVFCYCSPEVAQEILKFKKDAEALQEINRD